MNRKKYKFIAPYLHAPWYVKFPDRFEKGHEIKEDPNGWFNMYPDKNPTPLRMGPAIIKQLINSKYLEEVPRKAED